MLMIPTALSAQVGAAVNAGAAVRGAVVRGIPTPAHLGASRSSSDRRSLYRDTTVPKKPRADDSEIVASIMAVRNSQSVVLKRVEPAGPSPPRNAASSGLRSFSL